MYTIAYITQETLIALLLLIPAFRYLDRRFLHNRIRSLLYLVFAAYLCAVYVVVGLPDIGYYRFSPNVNLEPFLYMFSDLRSTVLNVIMFLPMGILLPILWAQFRSLWRSLAAGFLISLIIELLQIFTYRATDVNDLMTNTVGTLLGYIIGRTVLHFIPADFPAKQRTHIALVFGGTFAIMFVLHPILSRILYFMMK